jgi:hypothetical protein
MRGTGIVAVVLAIALAVSACSKITYRNPAVAPTGAVYRTKGHFFLGGLIGHKTVPAWAMCPGGVASMQSKFDVFDIVLGYLTLYIYTPRTYVIRCGQGGAP